MLCIVLKTVLNVGTCVLETCKKCTYHVYNPRLPGNTRTPVCTDSVDGVPCR